MSVKEAFLKNTLWVGLAQLLKYVLSYGIIVLLTRSLGAEGLGLYSFAFAYIGTFYILSDFGLNSLLVKDWSKEDISEEYFQKVTSTKAVLIVLSFFAAIIGAIFLEDMLPLLIVAVIELLKKVKTIPKSILRVKDSGFPILIGDLLEKTVTFLGALFSFWWMDSLVLFFVIMFFGVLLNLLVHLRSSADYSRYKFAFSLSDALSLLKRSYPFLLVTSASFIYVRIDTVMLGFLQSNEVVGWYTAGYRLLDILAMIPQTVLIFGFPAFSKLQDNMDHLQDLLENLIHYVFLLLIPATIGIWLLGPRILRFIYDIGSVESAISLNILITSAVFVALNLILGWLLSSADYQFQYSKVALSGAFLNLILNLILIPIYSLYGAAIATVLTYILMSLSLFYLVRVNLMSLSITSGIPIALFCCLPMALVVYALLDYHALIPISSGALTYGLCLLPFEWENLLWWYNEILFD